MTLKIAAKYAQYTNFAGNPTDFAAKSELLRQHCADVGTSFDAIVRSANYNTVIGATSAEVHARLDAIEARVLPFLGPDETVKFMSEYRSGSALGVGTPAEIIEKLRAMQELGLGYAIHYFPEAAYDLSGVELFEREVMPALA